MKGDLLGVPGLKGRPGGGGGESGDGAPEIADLNPEALGDPVIGGSGGALGVEMEGLAVAGLTPVAGVVAADPHPPKRSARALIEVVFAAASRMVCMATRALAALSSDVNLLSSKRRWSGTRNIIPYFFTSSGEFLCVKPKAKSISSSLQSTRLLVGVSIDFGPGLLRTSLDVGNPVGSETQQSMPLR